MSALAMAAPVLRVLFERVGRPAVHDLPDLLAPGGGGAVIVCNHVGWADSLWLAYAVYPRELRNMSKQELFASPVASWALRLGRSIAIDRKRPSPGSIKSAVEAVRCGELLLVFPSGSRSLDAFKRGAATIALHAQAPLVPAHYKGPKGMLASHLVGRPQIEVRFGAPIATAGMVAGRAAAILLTEELYRSIEGLRCAAA